MFQKGCDVFMKLTNYCVYLMHNTCETDAVALNDPLIQMVLSYT